MAAFHLVGDRGGYVIESEGALLLSHAGVEDDLEQQVAELVLQRRQVVPLAGVCDLIGFLDRVGRDGREII